MPATPEQIEVMETLMKKADEMMLDVYIKHTVTPEVFLECVKSYGRLAASEFQVRS